MSAGSGLFLMALLNADQAAEYLHMSYSNLAKLRVAGKGPQFLKMSPTKQGKVLYRREDLDAWLESKVRRSTCDQGEVG